MLLITHRVHDYNEVYNYFFQYFYKPLISNVVENVKVSIVFELEEILKSFSCQKFMYNACFLMNGGYVVSERDGWDLAKAKHSFLRFLYSLYLRKK